MQYREGEHPKTYYRTDRFFRVGDKWFFSTRENHEMGPYDSHEDAVFDLEFYLTQMASLKKAAKDDNSNMGSECATSQ